MAAVKTHSYLLEIGTEELPVGFLLPAQNELKEKVRQALSDQRLTYDEIQIYATPRRLTILIDGLPDGQETREVQLKGPPKRIAVGEDGNPTPAGLGFAKKSGVDFSELTEGTLDDKVDDSGEVYMLLNRVEPGRLCSEILPDILPSIVLSLTGSHFMTWGDHQGEEDIKFSRPIRWLTSVLDDQHLPLSIGPVHSSNKSMGHRVQAQKPVDILSISKYLSALETQGCVVANPQKRKDLIWQQLQQAADKLGGRVEPNEDLLNTVTMLVENPFVLAGDFDPAFLEIPTEVTTTVMISHQKYFPVFAKEGNELLPHFLVVSNGSPSAEDTIRSGNQRVLVARLKDGQFFFEDDKKTPLESRLEDLKGITFQKKLGSLYEKTERVEKLSKQVSQELGYDKLQQKQVARSARLCKADLVTSMVFEFTELQGKMGQIYAGLSGEDPAVADAIFEQYLPRHMGDVLPAQPVGIALSIADKLDTMAAVFSQEKAKLPTGSKDPLGLRRMAGGLIQIVLENKLTINLDALLRTAYQNLGGYAGVGEETAVTLMSGFILQRLKGVLLDDGIRYDVIDAVLEAGNPLQDLCDAKARMDILKELTANPDALKLLYEPANRISKILATGYQSGVSLTDVDPAKFSDPSEKSLFEAVKPLDPSVPYEQWLAALQGLAPVIEQFFESVLVNDKDELVKQNRYNLLSLLNSYYLRVGQFSKLVV